MVGSLRTVSENVLVALAAVAGAAAVCVGYGVFVEPRWYRRRTYRLEILPVGSTRPVTVLHLSDLHFRVNDRAKAAFLSSFEPPDVTVVTGDLIGEPDSVEQAVAALREVRGHTASFFVLGSNDYFAPKPLNYLTYFRGPRRRRRGVPNRSRALIEQLEADGWIHLRNRKSTIEPDGRRWEVVGLDDPHIERHDLRVATRSDPVAFGFAIVHSPDPAPELAALGYQLIVSGHTHGGQVRLPFVGALVTNSQLPTRLAMGLSRMGRALLHVSPGLGSSKFAPFRFLCRPEATILQLTSPGDGHVARNDQSSPKAKAVPERARSNTRV